jgi:hypothetical protein
MRVAVITDHLVAVIKAQIIIKVRHVVEKFRHVLIEREGECFCFVEFAIYLFIVRFCCSRILDVQIIIFK